MEEKVISASEMGGANSENLTISTESEQNNMANTVEQDITAGTSSEQVESAASEKPEKYSKLKYNFKKAYDFVSRHWLYFSVPLLIFALFFGILYSMDIFPFGTDNMSNYDLLAQIVPFYEHFYDVIDGKSSLFYSPAIAGGADVFGTLAYCAVSPFTFIFLFFGRTTVYNAVSFVLPLKLSCVACSAIFFLKKEFKNISEYAILIMSILYAYCGYMFVANTYINWVDFLIYMPFVVIGFKKLVTEKKVRYFAISYALMIYACFSIACFALFMIFIIFIAYILIACPKQERIETLAKMCYALLLAIGIALPILVPALFAYMRSGRNTGLFENMDAELWAHHLYAKFSYILSDTAFVFLTIVYFIKNRFKTKTDVFLFVTGVIIMAPVLVDEINNLMNAGSYMSYALRFGFLNATYALYMAGRLLNTVGEKSVNKRVNWVFSAVLAVVALGAVVFILKFNNLILNFDGSENSPLIDFSATFAHSTGGLEAIYQIALAIFVVFVIATVFYHFKLVSLKNITFVLIGVLAVQVAFYNIHLVRGNAFNPLRYDQFNAGIETIDKYDDRLYYRVKDNSATITNDAAFMTHTNSFGVFSSVIDNDNFVLTNFFNYEGNQTNSIEAAGGTFFSDSLLGYKYFFVHTDVDSESAKYTTKKRDYLVKLEETQEANFAMYENIGVFPNCYTVDSGTLEMKSNDFCTNMQELYEFLGGKGDLFTTVTFKEGRDANLNSLEVLTNEETGETIYSFKVNTSYTGHYYFDTSFPDNYYIGYNSSTSSDKWSLDYYSNVLVDTINYGYNKKGSGMYNFCIKSLDDQELDLETVENCVTAKILTNEKVLELSQYLKTRECEYTQKRNTFTINATAENDDTYVLLNYVSIEGFEATVNGKKAEVIDNGIKFLQVKLEKGENTVVFTYKSPYYKYIAIGAVLGAIIILALWLVLKKFPNVSKTLNPMVCVLAFLIALGIFAFFYMYPGTLFIKKLVMLLIA